MHFRRLELQQYRNDSIDAKNRLVLLLPRFSLANTVREKSASISKQADSFSSVGSFLYCFSSKYYMAQPINAHAENIFALSLVHCRMQIEKVLPIIVEKVRFWFMRHKTFVSRHFFQVKNGLFLGVRRRRDCTYFFNILTEVELTYGKNGGKKRPR